MATFIFDLQRFDSSGSGNSSGGGSSSGGSNAKTDSNIGVVVKEVWSDSLQVGNYSSLAVNGFINESNALRGVVSPTQYTGTLYGDSFYVSTLNNNTITNTDSLDTINFVD